MEKEDRSEIKGVGVKWVWEEEVDGVMVKRRGLPFNWVSLIQADQIIFCWGNNFLHNTWCMCVCVRACFCVCLWMWVQTMSHPRICLHVHVHSGTRWNLEFSYYQEDFQTNWVIYVFCLWIERNSVYEHGALTVWTICLRTSCPFSTLEARRILYLGNKGGEKNRLMRRQWQNTGRAPLAIFSF